MRTNLAIIEKAPYKGESLEVIEGRIQKGLSSYVQVGRDLKTINDNWKQYKKESGYATFENYCEERWGLSRTSAYEYIGAAEVATNLSGQPDKTNLPSLTQAVAMSYGLDSDQQKKIAAKTDFSTTTVKKLQTIIDDIKEPETKKKEKIETEEDRYSRLHSAAKSIYGSLHPTQRVVELHAAVDRLKEMEESLSDDQIPDDDDDRDFIDDMIVNLNLKTVVCREGIARLEKEAEQYKSALTNLQKATEIRRIK